MQRDWWREWSRTGPRRPEEGSIPDRDAPLQREDDDVATTTRRWFLSVAALGGAAATSGRVAGQSDGGPRQIELGGETAGWVGRSPADIEGETNPTLTLTPEETYQVTWENVDGAPHNFEIEDGEGEAVVESEIIEGEGETQTVEFTATEAMAEYLCRVHPTTMRGDISTASGSQTETPEETPDEGTEETTEETPEETPEETGDETTEEPAQPSFEQELVEEHRGDLARFTLSLGGAEEAEVVLGSESVNYEVSFTVVDGNGDDEVTVVVDTFVAGRGEESGIETEADDDEIRDYRQATPTISSPLDVALYPIEVRVDGRPADEAVLALDPRQTRAANAGVAPRVVSPSDDEAMIDGFTRRSEVATGDWAVTEFEASGLYATLEGGAAFDDESLGYDLTIQQADVVNVEPEAVPLDEVAVVVDEENDRFFAAVDSSTLQLEETYEATFTVTDASPYVPEDETEEVSARFTVVERLATFDVEGDELSVPASETTLSGTTTVAPGTTITVSAAGAGENPFQRTAQTTVGDDGSWSVSVDFSDLEPGTTFSAHVLGLSEVVDGEVASSG